ncbi:MobA/MobL family protein [Sphingomonas sp. LM7]|uniref:MobA/MobL family protein n=1 Tax=Sphingomonas sp. LM7 TaxID=1938607 RepID=UPI00209B282D|nr:MobA/MobL family protein [Sphingomonas sp. LM7]
MARNPTARKTATKAKPAAVPLASTDLPASAELKQFSNGAGSQPGFYFERKWWEGHGPRAGISPWVEKKIRVGNDLAFGTAARFEVLLPRFAPGEYATLAHLVARFDETLPMYERHALVQVKIELPFHEPYHVGYEVVRAFARQHFTVERAHPVILVAHLPGMAGSENKPHIHAIVLARELGPNGFGETNTRMCSDKGQADAWEAWQPRLADWRGER